jgi:sirohydrochlorin ferrochelatase
MSGMDETSLTRIGVLLAAHGTRSLQGQAEVQAAAQLVAQRLPGAAVRVGFLELAEPTLDDAVAALMAEGIRLVVVAPLLLFAAGHAKEDLPGVLVRAAGRHPQAAFRMAAHLGCHEAMLALSATRYEGALPHQEESPAPETAWLLVGRGSRDTAATAEMHRFAAMRQQRTAVAEARVAFLAMARPSLVDALEEAAKLPPRRIVVQPHLLFHGDLLTQLQQSVVEMANRRPDKQWLVTPHLGPAQEVADTVASRVRATISPQNDHPADPS